MAALSGLAAFAAMSFAVMALSAGPAGATLVCPPGVTNPKYCTNVPPVATTNSATNVKTTSATLNGTAGPNVSDGDITTYYFQWGRTSSYTDTTTPGTIGVCPAGVTNPKYCTTPAAEAVSATIGPLLPDTLYHFRIVATNSDGTTLGLDQTFTTAKVVVPPPPHKTKPIKSVNVPRSVKHNKKFKVTVHLRVRAKVTISFNHKTFREGSRRAGKFSQTLKAPRRKGKYTITFRAVGGNETQIVKKTIKVR
jgi:hypothetical protein